MKPEEKRYAMMITLLLVFFINMVALHNLDNAWNMRNMEYLFHSNNILDSNTRWCDTSAAGICKGADQIYMESAAIIIITFFLLLLWLSYYISIYRGKKP